MPQTKEQIKEELELLQLEDLRANALQRKEKVVGRKNRAAAIEMAIKRDRESQERIQAACYHKKGGKGVAQMFMGNDQNYAVVTHTLSHGPTIVICQRCGKVWRPPAKLPKKASTEQKAIYREQLTEYRRALALPTDNEASGTAIFEIVVDEDAAA